MPSINKGKARCAVNDLNLLLYSSVERKIQQRHFSFSPLLYQYTNVKEHNPHVFKQRLKNVWTSRSLRDVLEILSGKENSEHIYAKLHKMPSFIASFKAFKAFSSTGGYNLWERSTNFSTLTEKLLFFKKDSNFGSWRVTIGSPLIEQFFYMKKYMLTLESSLWKNELKSEMQEGQWVKN